MICSAEMLVLGDEVISMTKRFIRGIDVSAETLARDVIEKVGPGGHFLQEDHTYEHFRKELWIPSLMARQPYDLWSQEKVRNIIDTHKVPPLPGKTVTALEKLKVSGEKELVKAHAR
jgi:trimethylamine--corrinoid protein Co-methyltransferase